MGNKDGIHFPFLGPDYHGENSGSIPRASHGKERYLRAMLSIRILVPSFDAARRARGEESWTHSSNGYRPAPISGIFHGHFLYFQC